MLQWAQSAIANVTGTAEPVYGHEAFHSVAEQTKETPYTELTKDDLRWKENGHTCVETKTFYFTLPDGKICYAQVIYSSVMSVSTTAQFCAKVFYRDGKTPNLWASDNLSNWRFDKNHDSVYADKCEMVISEDGASYSIKSSVNAHCKVDVKVTRTAPGVKIGKDGITRYGKDPKDPWGTMYHYFWPSARVEGTYTTDSSTIDVNGKAFFIAALQGMKPHHAAARWNFADFQSPSFSASMMQFTTPPSYMSTTVNVGSIATADSIIIANSQQTAEHLASKTDEENGWPEPTEAKYTWAGKTADGKDLSAELVGPLGAHLDKVDVMAEVPRFVKQIVAGTVGTKPYVYQFGANMRLKLKIGDEVKEEDGVLFAEATFIS